MAEEKAVASAPYVQRIPRSNGKVDLYFRRGKERRKLTSPEGSQELRDEVNAILAQMARAERAQTPVVGTVEGMLRAYNRSAAFLTLARSTQFQYQYIIDELIEDAGDTLLSEVSRGWIKALRDAWALRGYRAANHRLQVLKNALKDAIEDERIDGDPFYNVGKVKRRMDAPEPNPVWEDAEVEAFIELAIARGMPGLARAVALGRWGGFRRGTICALPQDALITGRDDDGKPYHRLYWKTEKRGVICDKPADSRLMDLLTRSPNRAPTVAYNMYDAKWQARSLN
jgi:hypothetical protein